MNLSYPSVQKTFALLLRLFVLALVLCIPIVFVEIAQWELASNATFKTIYLSLVAILTNIFGIFYAMKRIKAQGKFQLFNEFRFSKIQFLPFVVLGAFALSFLVDPLGRIMPLSDRYENFFTSLLSMRGYSFFVIVLIIPTVEEMLFRGIILKGFLKNYPPFKAIVLSSLFFAIIHFNLTQLTTAFLTGLFFGYLYWQTRSLSICILAHTIYNAIFYFGFHALNFGFSIESSITDTSIYLALYFFAAITLTASILMIYKKNTLA